MKSVRTIRLLITFYKNFALFSLLINACCISIFLKNGFSSFLGIFWFKVASLAISYYFINSYKNKEYYYYFNLGISKFLLWVVSLVFDFSFFISLIILANKFK